MDLKRLQDWARIIDPASASEETATARTKLNELLKKNGLTLSPGFGSAVRKLAHHAAEIFE